LAATRAPVCTAIPATSVARHLLKTCIHGGYTGDMVFDHAGGPVTAPVTSFRIQLGAKNATGTPGFEDATVDRVITPPASVVHPPWTLDRVCGWHP
jgi:hypothetical protein